MHDNYLQVHFSAILAYNLTHFRSEFGGPKFDFQLDLTFFLPPIIIMIIKLVNKLPDSVLHIILQEVSLRLPTILPDDAIYQENLVLGSIVICTGT